MSWISIAQSLVIEVLTGSTALLTIEKPDKAKRSEPLRKGVLDYHTSEFPGSLPRLRRGLLELRVPLALVFSRQTSGGRPGVVRLLLLDPFRIILRLLEARRSRPVGCAHFFFA